MYPVFISIPLEVNSMKIVEIITFTLKIPAKGPMLIGLVGAAQNLLSRYYALLNLDKFSRLLIFNEFSVQ